MSILWLCRLCVVEQLTMMSTSHVQCPDASTCGVSEIGLKRMTNEDHFLVAHFFGDKVEVSTNVPRIAETQQIGDAKKCTLLVVADGVGGARFGAYCSQTVVRQLFMAVSERLQSSDSDGPSPEHFLREEVLSIRRQLLADAARHPERSGMATTLTAVLVFWPKWFLVHVGDSRCYLLHAESMKQLTVDHNLAEAMKSRLPADQHSSVLNLRHVIWNSVSASSHECTPDVAIGQLQEGDSMLLCTDGLTLHVENNEIAQIMSDSESGHAVCDRLASLAIDRGARDNVAIVAARFGDANTCGCPTSSV
jgi:protein phosphatase